MLKKICSLDKLGVFSNFQWDQFIRNKNGKVTTLADVNIFYGRNYSGKTTVSRVFRSFETLRLPPKFNTPIYQIECENAYMLSSSNLNQDRYKFRVFNEDFIKDNLKFVIDEESHINSFAVLGEDNTRIEQNIARLEFILGDQEDGSGMYLSLSTVLERLGSAKETYNSAASILEKKIKEKANTSDTAIKHNKVFGDANYNATKLKKDIDKVIGSNYLPIDEDEKEKLVVLLKEDLKPPVERFGEIFIEFSSLFEKSIELASKKITLTSPIQELVNNNLLEEWVRKGRGLHENKRETCGFCGSPLQAGIWDSLDKHFNRESEKLRVDLENVLIQIKQEIARAASLFTIDKNRFYSSFYDQLDTLEYQVDHFVTVYKSALEEIYKQLSEKLDDIYIPIVINRPDFNVGLVEDISSDYDRICEQSNIFSDELSAKKKNAKDILLLDEVYRFVVDINYEEDIRNRDLLKRERDSIVLEKDRIETEIKEKEAELDALKVHLKNETKGAERVNQFLNDYFGHQYLTLIAIEEEGENSSAYKFEVQRNGKKAFNLSEGEASLIAFCYFMAKLDDLDTQGSDPVIWIDDPISSLDSNHIFFVYSIINSQIVKPRRFKQLFISTHNLDFLKYLKRLYKDYKGSGESRRKVKEYFLIERCGETSAIYLMPDYLKNYVTEFNYLFHQLYKCANAGGINDENYQEYYNFGNNARKFLEIFLYYKYPNGVDGDSKLAMFFGENSVPAILTDRINNEYSHLSGAFERGAIPVDIPEMKTTAALILRKLKENDIDQYKALLRSIGENEEELEAAEV